MGKIKVERCDIEGLCVITPTVFKDDRGYFVETYNKNDFAEAGLYRTISQSHQREYFADCIFKRNIHRVSL